MKFDVLLLLALLGAACASEKTGRLADTVEVPPMTEREIRARVLEYARHWNGVVEETADEIARSTTDPEIRCDAMRWKMEAVAACQTAAMRTDPIAAAVDLWALALQMVDYLETGPGRERLGPYREIVLEAARQLEADVANSYEDEATRERTRIQVEEWVAKNPVPRSLINRPSTMPMLAEMAGESKLSAMAALRSTEQRAVDFLDRFDFYLEVLPQGLRWQMEYVMERHLLSQEEKQTLLGKIDVMTASLESVGSLSRDVPSLIAEERERIRAAVDDQRQLILADMDRERAEIMQAVSAQREALTRDVGVQREAIMASLREQQEKAFASLAEERQAIFAAVDAQRRETLAEIERLTRLTVAESGGEGRDTIDHFFRRAALLGGGLVALLFLSGLVFVRLTRRPRLSSAGTGG